MPGRQRVLSGVAIVVVLGGLLSACTGDQRPPPRAPKTVVAAPDSASTPEPSSAGCVPQASYDPMPSLPAPDRLPEGSTMARIRTKGRLIVGTSGDKPLLAARDPRTGELQGIDIDLSREVARAIFGDPNRVEFRTISSADRIPALTSGKVDMVAHSMTMTCDRWKQVGFSSSYYRDGQRLLVRLDSQAKEAEDLKNPKICAARGTTAVDSLRRLGIRNILEVNDAADCLARFQRDEIDAIASTEINLRGFQQQDPYAKIIGRQMSDEPRGLAFPRENVDVIRFVNALLERLRADGTLDTILRRRLAPLKMAVSIEEPTYGRIT